MVHFQQMSLLADELMEFWVVTFENFTEGTTAQFLDNLEATL